ncbi:DUF397 domain-containing protein [Streptomyces sp. NPDC086182]|uniref:DUF397 domain-containing protein n=1 Tax=Streptomyces sp. NPDC086182 TaxID=3155058 RepID=UPI00341633CF
MGPFAGARPDRAGVPRPDRSYEGDALPETSDQSLIWTRSTHTDSTSCVEWARPPGAVLVRDSKRPAGARLPVSGATWQAFVDWVVQKESLSENA